MIRILGKILGFVVLYCCLVQSTRFTNMETPVKWAFTVKQNGMEAELLFTATLQDKWKIYSQFTPDGGPIPTSFSIVEGKNFKMMGKVTEPTPTKYFDKSFDTNVLYFSKQVTFGQKIKVLTKEKFAISGTLTFMCCDDSKCLPPDDVPFTFYINN